LEASLLGVVWIFLVVAANFSGPVYILDFLVVLLGAVTLGILALSGKIEKAPRRWATPLLGAACLSLFLTGILGSGAIIRLFAFPVSAVSFAMFTLLWASSANSRSLAATLCYWLGVPLTIFGALRFSYIVVILNQRSIHYPPGQFELHQPNVEGELILWCIPALLVCIGLKLSNNFGKVWVVVAAVPLLLLNPAILWIGTALRLPVSL